VIEAATRSVPFRASTELRSGDIAPGSLQQASNPGSASSTGPTALGFGAFLTGNGFDERPTGIDRSDSPETNPKLTRLTLSTTMLAMRFQEGISPIVGEALHSGGALVHNDFGPTFFGGGTRAMGLLFVLLQSH
jgi:hypothetical protein